MREKFFVSTSGGHIIVNSSEGQIEPFDGVRTYIRHESGRKSRSLRLSVSKRRLTIRDVEL